MLVFLIIDCKFSINQKLINYNNLRKFESESTIGIDHSVLNIEGGTINILDFAGQLEYTVTHQFFLSSEVFF